MASPNPKRVKSYVFDAAKVDAAIAAALPDAPKQVRDCLFFAVFNASGVFNAQYPSGRERRAQLRSVIAAAQTLIAAVDISNAALWHAWAATTQAYDATGEYARHTVQFHRYLHDAEKAAGDLLEKTTTRRGARKKQDTPLFVFALMLAREWRKQFGKPPRSTRRADVGSFNALLAGVCKSARIPLSSDYYRLVRAVLDRLARERRPVQQSAKKRE